MPRMCPLFNFIASTSILRIWLYFLHCDSAVLRQLTTCSTLCLPLYNGQDGSYFNLYFTRFALDGSTSQTYLRMKPNLSGVTCHISFQLRLIWKKFSQLVHRPCWLCWTAFWITLLSSSFLSSLISISLLALPSMLDHHSIFVRPKLLSVWLCLRISFSFRLSLAFFKFLLNFPLPSFFQLLWPPDLYILQACLRALLYILSTFRVWTQMTF